MFDKMKVAQTSLRKLEASQSQRTIFFNLAHMNLIVISDDTASYALIVRGAEYADFPEALKDMVRNAAMPQSRTNAKLTFHCTMGH